MPNGALLNIPVTEFKQQAKFVLVNGQYKFLVKFYNTGTSNLSGNVNYPQNQEIYLDSLSLPKTLEIRVGYGNYTITGVTVKVFHNNIEILSQPLNNIVISCLANCTVIPTATQVTPITSTSYEVKHNSGTVTSLQWEIKLGSDTKASGTVSNLVNSNNFIISTPELSSLPHTLLLKGVTCIGQAAFVFTPPDNTPPVTPPVTQTGTFEATAIIT